MDLLVPIGIMAWMLLVVVVMQLFWVGGRA